MKSWKDSQGLVFPPLVSYYFPLASDQRRKLEKRNVKTHFQKATKQEKWPERFARAAFPPGFWCTFWGDTFELTLVYGEGGEHFWADFDVHGEPVWADIRCTFGARLGCLFVSLQTLLGVPWGHSWVLGCCWYTLGI